MTPPAHAGLPPDHDPTQPTEFYRTAHLPGVGGAIKQREEDFLVDELPLYPPSGQGEHVMLLIEKRGLSTLHMASELARHFGVHLHAVGYAGLKDKLAITRQHVTVHVPGKRMEDFPSLRHDRIAILWADMHDRKLRRGHLAGNGFSIRVRGVSPSAATHAHRVLACLEAKGVPNIVGEQRFGQWDTNHRVGLALVQGNAREACDLLLGPTPGGPSDESRDAYAAGDLQAALAALPRSAQAERRVLEALARGKRPEHAVERLGRTERAFMASALQSAIFNEVLRQRLRDGTADTLLEGDVAVVHDARRTTFVVSKEEAASGAIAERLARVEVSPTGPMWGPRMRPAQGTPGEIEHAALERFGLTPQALERFAGAHKDTLEGDRRPLRVPLMYPQVEGGADAHGTYVRCGFELPRGSFATTVMAEVMKTPNP